MFSCIPYPLGLSCAHHPASWEFIFRKGKSMKNYILIILVVIAMLGMQVGTAAAASSSITLISVEHGYQGPVFTFRVSGEFSKAELKGFLHVENGADYDLYCKQ